MDRIGKLEKNFDIFEEACIKYIAEKIQSVKESIIVENLSKVEADHFKMQEDIFKIKSLAKTIENQFGNMTDQLNQ